MSRKRVAVVVLIVFSIVTGYYLLLVYSRVTHQRVERVYVDLRRFATFLRMYYGHNGRFPGPTFGHAVKSILKDPFLATELKSGCSTNLWEGRDVWGHELVYSVADDGQSVCIRSVGRNGRDDGGGGDDIELVVSQEPPYEHWRLPYIEF